MATSARRVLVLAALSMAVLAVAGCDGWYRITIPCTPPQAEGTPADTLIPCEAFRKLPSPDSTP